MVVCFPSDKLNLTCWRVTSNRQKWFELLNMIGVLAACKPFNSNFRSQNFGYLRVTTRRFKKPIATLGSEKAGEPSKLLNLDLVEKPHGVWQVSKVVKGTGCNVLGQEGQWMAGECWRSNYISKCMDTHTHMYIHTIHTVIHTQYSYTITWNQIISHYIAYTYHIPLIRNKYHPLASIASTISISLMNQVWATQNRTSINSSPEETTI